MVFDEGEEVSYKGLIAVSTLLSGAAPA